MRKLHYTITLTLMVICILKERMIPIYFLSHELTLIRNIPGDCCSLFAAKIGAKMELIQKCYDPHSTATKGEIKHRLKRSAGDRLTKSFFYMTLKKLLEASAPFSGFTSTMVSCLSI